jgi:hypothetical protein
LAFWFRKKVVQFARSWAGGVSGVSKDDVGAALRKHVETALAREKSARCTLLHDSLWHCVKVALVATIGEFSRRNAAGYVRNYGSQFVNA